MTTNRQSLFEFEADLTKFAAKIDVDLSVVVKKIVFDLFTKIVLRTPVDTGRARASWGIEAGQPGTDFVTEGSHLGRDQATDVAKAQLSKLGLTPKEAAYQVWWIYNNLPYVESLEYGHSKQAPAGMVRVSLAEVEAEIDSILGEG